ncbi:MAG: SMI1/KNR4 family protein [Pseudomonadota bacterium]
MPENAARAPNPYGPTSEAAVAAFEQSLGHALPKPYRDWLFADNGADFEKDTLPLEGGDAVSVHHVYGLHDGPEVLRLQTQWRLADRYELEAWASDLARFLAFADTGTGDILLLDLEDGSVLLYEHDVEDAAQGGMPGRLVRVAPDFGAFLGCLMSLKEHLIAEGGQEAFDAFEAQLERLRAQRRARVQARLEAEGRKE